MTEEFQNGPEDPGQFFMAELDGRPALGAFLPERRQEVTVFWCGHVPLAEFSLIIKHTEDMFKKAGGEVTGFLTGFGSEKERVGPSNAIENFLKPQSSFSHFDAYKAEITGRAGKALLWANVKDMDAIALEDGGDNVGLTLPPQLIGGAGRTVVIDAIARTMKLQKKVATSLVDNLLSGIGVAPRPRLG